MSWDNSVARREQMLKQRAKRHRRRVLIAYTLRTLTVLIVVGVLCLTVSVIRMLSGILRESNVAVMSEINLSFPFSNTSDSAGVLTQGENKIILDAGHGGHDVGTMYDEIYEKDINLQVTLKVGELLEKEGLTVIYTRDQDESIELDNRSLIANQERADLFISVHCNYYEKDSGISGFETYYQENSKLGAKYAEAIDEAIDQSGITVARGAKTEDFSVLRNTNMPAVLIELGYISNKYDRNNLTDDVYQDQLAKEIAEGIVNGMLDEARN